MNLRGLVLEHFPIFSIDFGGENDFCSKNAGRLSCARTPFSLGGCSARSQLFFAIFFKHFGASVLLLPLEIPGAPAHDVDASLEQRHLVQAAVLRCEHKRSRPTEGTPRARGADNLGAASKRGTGAEGIHALCFMPAPSHEVASFSS